MDIKRGATSFGTTLLPRADSLSSCTFYKVIVHIQKPEGQKDAMWHAFLISNTNHLHIKTLTLCLYKLTKTIIVQH